MTDVFEEVEEAHRKDRFDEAWRKYGWIVWLAGAAIIIAVALNEYFSWQRSQTQAANAAALEAAIEALEAAEYDDAADRFSAIAAEGSSLSPIAAQYLAQVRLEGQGNLDGAIEALESGIGDGADPLTQMALLKTAYLQSDTLDLRALEDLLAPLLADETPIGALAQELVAAKAFETGDFDRARRDFNSLRFSAYAPQGLVQRAEIALAAIPRPSPGTEDVSPAEPSQLTQDVSPPGNAPDDEAGSQTSDDNDDPGGE